MKPWIRQFQASEILDSRGNPTLAVRCVLTDHSIHEAQVPSGASTGSREAYEMRDGDSSRYRGLGVLKAIQAIEGELAQAILAQQPEDQSSLDRLMIELDGTTGKTRLGGNSLLGCSMAFSRALAHQQKQPLYRSLYPDLAPALIPVPYLNIWNGGVHAQWQGSDFQEYMIVPWGAPSFHEAMRWSSEIYHALQGELKKNHLPTGVGDEGGFAPPTASNRAPLDFISKAIKQAGLRPGTDVAVALDLAASAFHGSTGYNLRSENRTLDSLGMVDYCAALARDYPFLVSLEDPLSESDPESWPTLTERLGHRLQIIGDDIYCTNPSLIENGIRNREANAVLIKPNQIGTISETRAAIKQAGRGHWRVMLSHRSGETPDSFIADLAVASQAGQIKTGAPARGERIAKYNRLMAIERELGSESRYAGPGLARANLKNSSSQANARG
jgi:enolase